MQSSEGSGATGVVLAVDIGGTKTAVGLVDRTGSLTWCERIATPSSADREDVWDAVAGLIARAVAHHPPIACGVGCGGPMDLDAGLVSPLNIGGWRGFPLRERVAEVTGVATWIDNDAKALALGEGWTGTARGEQNYLSMVVSTGVGAGVVLNGRLLDGRRGNAGHIGHMIVEPDGRRCECGAYGCLEAEASGTAIAGITGRPAAEAGDEVVERTGRLVGRAVASVANLLDLRLATVAGSVAFGFGRPFFAAAQREIDSSARISFSAGCRIVPSELGPAAPLVGAAALAWRGLAGG